MSTSTISLVEYDITSLSDWLPGSYSHIGVRFEGFGEINFGSFRNGNYEPIGKPQWFDDRVGYITGPMSMPSKIVASVNYDSNYTQKLWEQTLAFAQDLYNKKISYHATPNDLERQANSNSAAAFIAELVGFDLGNINLNGIAPGFLTDLAAKRFGLNSPEYYRAKAVEKLLADMANVPTPTPRPLECFPASTPILTLSGTVPIQHIRVGDNVLAFDPSADRGRGALVPAKVTKLFTNTTREWIELSDPASGATLTSTLVCTPGHHFLDEHGNFPTIAELLLRGGANGTSGVARIVLADGAVRKVTGRRIVWSEDTAHLFGGRASIGGGVAGSLALAA